MSAISEAMKGIKQLLLLQEQMRRLELAGDRQAAALGALTDDLIALDKRIVRIETMIEMSTRASGQPRIEQ